MTGQTKAPGLAGPGEILKSALKLAENGYHLLPVRPNSKLPAIKNFPSRASRDPEQIRRWFQDNPGLNLGISTSRFGDDEGLVVVDIDDKDDRNGSATIFTLDMQGFELPQTVEQKTPSGGRHLIYRAPVAMRQGSNVLGPGVDIRSRGGLIVAAPSVIGGRFYSMVAKAGADTMIPAPAPQWLIDRIGVADTRPAKAQEVLPGVDPVRAEARARDYLRDEAPIGQAGDRNDTAYKVAARIKDFGCSPELAEALMHEWNESCEPPLDDVELGHCVRSAYAYGKEPQGAAAPEAVFTAAEKPAGAPDGDGRGNGGAMVQAGHPGIVSRCLADIESRPIEWLWPGVIALGKLSMIAGDPGLGKSQATLNIAATVTTGGKLPDGGKAPRGDVILISAEDDPADTIRPRLEAAGADLSRVHVVDGVRVKLAKGEGVRGVDLTSDVLEIEALADRLPDLKLIVIDPVSAFLGATDSHKNAEVRAALMTVCKMAEARGVAVLCVTHLNKAGGASALSRVSGSGAFVALARAAFLVTRCDDEDDERMMIPLKNNIGRDRLTRFFRIKSVALPTGIEAPAVEWLDKTEEIDADEVVNPASKGSDRSGASMRRCAKAIREALIDGPKAATEIKAMLCETFASRTIDRAKQFAGVVSSKQSDGWQWALPSWDDN